MPYIITCGDEGVQINEGTRLGIVGAGIRFEHADAIVSALKKTLPLETLYLASSEENDWTKAQFELTTWEQTSATMQQQAEALADKLGITYVGLLPFADPQVLGHELKGHMVRPQGIHIANKVMITLGGGEQTYHLGHFVVSGDWIAQSTPAVVKAALSEQIAFYTKLAKSDKTLPIEVELAGELGEEVARANLAMLQKVGLAPEVIPEPAVPAKA